MVEIRYFAAARAARGVAREELDGAAVPATLAELLDILGATHTGATAGGMTLGQIFERCSFLVDGRTVTRDAAASVDLGKVARVDVLPPFAGG